MKLNPQDVHMNTPLHFCCNNGHMESATLLMIVSGCYGYCHHTCIVCMCVCLYIILCADLPAGPFMYKYNTGLYYCVYCCFVQHGADVNVTNDRGDTPLHNAAR